MNRWQRAREKLWDEYEKTDVGTPEAVALIREVNAVSRAWTSPWPWRWYWRLRAVLTGRVGR